MSTICGKDSSKDMQLVLSMFPDDIGVDLWVESLNIGLTG